MALDMNVAMNITARVQGEQAVKDMSNDMGQAADNSGRLSEAGQRLVNTLQQQINTFGKTKDELAMMRAEQAGVTNQVAPLLQRLKELRDAQEEAGKGAQHLALNTSGARRELIVLAHEMSQGNYSRLGGSLMVMAERMDVLPLIFSTMGLAIAGVVAGLGTFVYAAVKGYEQSHALANAIKLTGDYAGVTAGQVNTMALQMAKATSSGVVATHDALNEVIKTGRIAGPALVDVGTAALEMSKLTGESTDKVVADLAKMADGVTKWAVEHNKQYHFMDLALYDHIKALEDSGREMDAIRLVAQALEKQMGQELPKNLGYLQRAWNWVKDAAKDAWDQMLGAGRAATVEDNIRKVQHQLSQQQSLSNVMDFFHLPHSNLSAGMADNQAKLRGYDQQQQDAQLKAQREAEKKAADERGVEAKQAIERIRDQTDKQHALTAALRDYRKEVAALAAAGQPVSAAQQAQDEAAIRHKYRTPKTPKSHLETAYDTERNGLGGKIAELNDQIRQFEEYGKVVDKSTLAQLNFQIVSGKLKGLSGPQIATLRQMAGAVDGLNKQLAFDKVGAEIDAKIKSLDAETIALREGKAASKEAATMQEYEKKGVEKTSYAYQILAQAVHANLTAHNEADNKAWSDQQAQIVAGIREQIDGLGQSSLQQKILTNDRKIDAEVVKQSKNETAAGLADLIARADEAKQAYAAAVAEMDTASKDFYTGFREGVSSLFDTLQNRASDGKKLFEDAVNGMTSALTKFAETGKLSVADLAKSVVDDLIQMEVKANIVLPLMQMINAYANGQSPAPIQEGLGGPTVSGGRAGGGPVNPGELYQVNERGPELLSVGGKNFLMMGNQPGTVTPNNQLGQGGGATVHQYITVDARGAGSDVDAKIRSAMQQAQNNAVMAVTQSLRNGGTIAKLSGTA